MQTPSPSRPDELAYFPEQPSQRTALPVTSAVFPPLLGWVLVSLLTGSGTLGVLGGLVTRGLLFWWLGRRR